MVSKTSSPPSTQMPPLPPHPSQLQQMSAGNMEAQVSENPDSPEYLGMRSPGLHKRLLGVLRRSSWVYFSWPSQLCVHLWLIHVSKCRLSQQALRILNRHQHLFLRRYPAQRTLVRRSTRMQSFASSVRTKQVILASPDVTRVCRSDRSHLANFHPNCFPMTGTSESRKWAYRRAGTE